MGWSLETYGEWWVHSGSRVIHTLDDSDHVCYRSNSIPNLQPSWLWPFPWVWPQACVRLSRPSNYLCLFMLSGVVKARLACMTYRGFSTACSSLQHIVSICLRNTCRTVIHRPSSLYLSYEDQRSWKSSFLTTRHRRNINLERQSKRSWLSITAVDSWWHVGVVRFTQVHITLLHIDHIPALLGDLQMWSIFIITFKSRHRSKLIIMISYSRHGYCAAYSLRRSCGSWALSNYIGSLGLGQQQYPILVREQEVYSCHARLESFLGGVKTISKHTIR